MKNSVLFLLLLLGAATFPLQTGLGQEENEYVTMAKNVCLDEVKAIFKEADDGSTPDWGRLKLETEGRVETYRMTVTHVGSKSYETAYIRFHTYFYSHSLASYTEAYVEIPFSKIRKVADKGDDGIKIVTKGKDIEVIQKVYKNTGREKIFQRKDVQHSKAFSIDINAEDKRQRVLRSLEKIAHFATVLDEY